MHFFCFEIYVYITKLVLSISNSFTVRPADAISSEMKISDLDEGFTTRLSDEFWKRHDSLVSFITHVNLQSWNIKQCDRIHWAVSSADSKRCFCLKEIIKYR